VGEVFHAIGVFFEQLAAVEFGPLLLAICAHVAKTACTSRAWRNTIAAAYPETEVPWRSIYGAYVSGVGVNAVVPARGGDVVRLYLAHRTVAGAAYTTLASTLAVLAIFDSAAAALLFGYALTLGVLPGLGLLPHLPGFDFAWIGESPELAIALGLVAVIVAIFGGMWLRFRVHDLRERLVQGVAVLRNRSAYLRSVAAWQAADWSLRFVSIWFFLGAFGIEQTLKNVLLVQVTTSLASLVPVSPGGIGTEQAFIVFVFRDAVPRSVLLAFSVGMRLTLTAVNAIVGFTALFLMLGHVRWRDVVGGEKPAPEG
jgi:uncharacterized membrane protein YbhN (UPF0104 family)